MMRFVQFASVGLLALALAGCAPSQADIEKSVRTEMQTQLGVTITAVALTKQADGSYAGTATAQNGDAYDVTTLPPSGNKIEWKAIQGQVMIEKVLRDGIKQQMGGDVKTLQLTKSGAGTYAGTAELTSGQKIKVSTHMEGTTLKWEAAPETP